MRTLLYLCALIFGVYSANIGVCQFATDDYTGTITFTEKPNDFSVEVSGTITATTKADRIFGLHIHQFGDIRNSDSAGSHFNPYNQTHGCSYPNNHLGDLGDVNFTANAEASLPIKTVIIGADLTSTLYTLIGRALVLHDKEDPCTPTGPFGNRIAQCVIGLFSGTTGYNNPTERIPAPDAICVFDELNYITFSQKPDNVNTVQVTRSLATLGAGEDIFFSTEPVNSTDFKDDKQKLFANTDTTTEATAAGLSIRTSINIIGKAVYYKDNSGTPSVQYSCVIGFMNPNPNPSTTTTTTTSATTGTTGTTGDAATTGTTGDATTTTTITTTTGTDTTTTTGTDTTTTGNATSTTTTGSTNSTSDASTSTTSGSVINPALNTTDTSGGAVLGIIFATFILLGLAWYTYVNRGNNQRRIGYFGV